jgi:ATP-binding cassette subfamily F protein uup
MTQDKELGVSGSNDQIMVRGQPRHVVSYLKEFLFSEAQARAPVSALSGGEVARLLLARILAQPSNLLILDEPTNDLDVETLDLLQEVLDGYDGTVLLVSHDRDFLDRVATKTIASAGNGKWIEYAGGWSDYISQRKIVEKEQAAKQKNKPKSKDKDKSGATATMSFSQEHRLKELPAVIERLEAEIAKLEVYMSDPDLFTTEPVKFQKATEALVERHNLLSDAEEEWLTLEELAAKP